MAVTATETNIAGISLIVPAKCQVAAGPLLIAANAGRANTASSTVSITCTTTTLFNVRLDPVGNLLPGAANKPISVLTGTSAYALILGPAVSSNRHLPGSADTVFGIGSGTPMILTVSGQTMQDRSVAPREGTSAVTVTFIF